MSRARGNAAPKWVAGYLRRWYPCAEATPNGRPGRDVLGTPGLAIEVKTGTEWRHSWLAQAAGYVTGTEIAVLIYMPPGLGEKHVADAQCILPLRILMPLLVGSGYAPEPKEKP